MQFNHRLTAKQAAVKAKIMYGTTKGRRLVRGYARKAFKLFFYMRMYENYTHVSVNKLINCSMSNEQYIR